MAPMLTDAVLHKFSQLVYLDSSPAMGTGDALTVGALADYYLESPTGVRRLKRRFGGIEKEYGAWLDFLETGIEDVRGFRIRNVLDDNEPEQSGFYGCGYLSPEGELVTAFRGSEMLGNESYKNDYRMDFSLAWDDHPVQHGMVDQYLERFEDFARRPFYITGHSLGGNLAAYGGVRSADNPRFRGCCTFNGPGFGARLVKESRDAVRELGDRLRLYQNRYDLVSSLLLDLGEPMILASTVEPPKQGATVGELFYPHSNFVFAPEGEGFLRDPTGEKSPVCKWVRRLSELFLKLPAFLRREIGEVTLNVIYSVQPPKKQVEFLLEQVSRSLLQQDAPTMKQAGLEAASALYAAKQLWLTPRPTARIYETLLREERRDQAQLADTILLLVKLLQYVREGESCEDCGNPEAEA